MHAFMLRKPIWRERERKLLSSITSAYDANQQIASPLVCMYVCTLPYSSLASFPLCHLSPSALMLMHSACVSKVGSGWVAQLGAFIHHLSWVCGATRRWGRSIWRGLCLSKVLDVCLQLYPQRTQNRQLLFWECSIPLQGTFCCWCSYSTGTLAYFLFIIHHTRNLITFLFQYTYTLAREFLGAQLWPTRVWKGRIAHILLGKWVSKWISSAVCWKIGKSSACLLIEKDVDNLTMSHCEGKTKSTEA